MKHTEQEILDIIEDMELEPELEKLALELI